MKANEADRLLLKRMLRTNIFAADCTCPKCFTTGYCNYPYSCLIDHSRDELLVQPQKRPTLAPDIEGRFEEHTLAQAAIEYFSRPKSEMDAVQLEALENYHQLAAEVHLIDVLNSKDLRLQLIGSGPRPQLSEHSMQQLLSIFNELFFFGSLMDIHFSWSTKFDNWEKRNHHPICSALFARTTIRDDDGKPYHAIQMHPTYTSAPVQMEQTNVSKAEERFGTILHEVIHAFLAQHTCCKCVVVTRYRGEGHGRGFQLIAKAMEKKALELLGVQIRIGRLDVIMGDMRRDDVFDPFAGPDFRPRGPSAHDMEVYRFLEPL
jgi:hypothetical protein